MAGGNCGNAPKGNVRGAGQYNGNVSSPRLMPALADAVLQNGRPPWL